VVCAVTHRRKLLKAIAALRADANMNAPPSDAFATIDAGRDTVEHRQVTIMFSFLVGWKALAAQIDPQELREIITAYQNCVAETVRDYDGFVVKYLGDGDSVLVCFGYPQEHDDHAERAVLAGLALAQGVAGLKTCASLQTSISITTGPAGDDLIGSGEAHEPGIIGEAVKLAAPPERTREPNTVTVVIDESTQKLLGNLLDLGPKDSKGAAIREIAEIARVPLGRRSALYIDLANLMIDFTRVHCRLRDPKVLQEMVKEFKKRISDVGKARSLMAAATLQLKSAIAKFDDKYGETDRDSLVAPHPIDKLLNEVHDWLNRPPPGAIKFAEARRGRGRPPRPAHPLFYHFLWTLLVMVNVEDGKLTFNKNYPTRGTLVQALTLLRPHMPQGFIPEVLPVGLLVRAQKIAKGGVEALEATLRAKSLEFGEKMLDRLIYEK
jgi:class 3 adenylate cyclase